MNITFITKYGISKLENGKLYSSGASARLRVIVPATHLSQEGHSVQILTIQPGQKLEPSQINGEVIVISKIIDPNVLDDILALPNKKIILDLCDNRLENTEIGNKLSQVIKKSALCIANTEEMHKKINQHKPNTAIIISDPVEGLKQTPYIPENDTKRIKLVWFGHQDGFLVLTQKIPEIVEKNPEKLFSLNVITGITNEICHWVHQFNKTNSKVYITLTQWSENATLNGCLHSDVVIIPSTLTEFNLTKSPNRLLQGLWFGKSVAAYPLPSYKPYNGFAYLDENIGSAIKKVVEDTSSSRLDKIYRGQNLVEKYHSREIISTQWITAFGLI